MAKINMDDYQEKICIDCQEYEFVHNDAEKAYCSNCEEMTKFFVPSDVAWEKIHYLTENFSDKEVYRLIAKIMHQHDWYCLNCKKWDPEGAYEGGKCSLSMQDMGPDGKCIKFYRKEK